jgi:hypothetical protein
VNTPQTVYLKDGHRGDAWRLRGRPRIAMRDREIRAEVDPFYYLCAVPSLPGADAPRQVSTIVSNYQKNRHFVS